MITAKNREELTEQAGNELTRINSEIKALNARAAGMDKNEYKAELSRLYDKFDETLKDVSIHNEALIKAARNETIPGLF